MKKFKALWFVTAIIAVMAVASMASATTTKFLGVDTNGKVIVINVDPTKTTGNKITYEGNVITGAPAIGNDDGHTVVKAFDYEGGILIVSTDATDANNARANVYNFTVNDAGDFEFKKSYPGAISGDIRDVVTLNGNPVVLATKSIATISNDKFISFKLSVDVAFQYNSNLYVVSGDSTGATGPQIFEFSGIDADWDAQKTIYERQAGSSAPVKSRDIGVKLPVTVVGGATSTVVIGDYIYITTGRTYAAGSLGAGGSFDVIAIPTASNSFMDTAGLAIDKIDSTFVSETGEYFALFEKDNALYVLARQSDGDLYLTKLTLNTDKTAFTKQETILSGLCSKLGAEKPAAPANAVNVSCDIYVSDGVIGVVNHGKALAIFTENDAGGWDFVESSDFKTAAMISSASSSTDDDSKTTTSTLVEITSIPDTAVQEAIVTNSGATAASDFLTAATAGEVSGNGTTPSDAAVKNIRDELDDEKATVSAVKDFKPTADGYVLVNAAYNAATTRVFFVELASSSASVAAENDFTEATLLNDKGEKITTGTSKYATAKLSKDKSYTMVTATKSSSSTDTDTDTTTTSSGSSSSGCNAGFAAVSALLALAFFKKSR